MDGKQKQIMAALQKLQQAQPSPLPGVHGVPFMHVLDCSLTQVYSLRPCHDYLQGNRDRGRERRQASNQDVAKCRCRCAKVRANMLFSSGPSSPGRPGTPLSAGSPVPPLPPRPSSRPKLQPGKPSVSDLVWNMVIMCYNSYNIRGFI